MADYTAFYNAQVTESAGGKVGYLAEYGETEKIFSDPDQETTRDYVTGRFG